MVQFYKKFPDFQKVSTLSTLFSWSHFIEFIKIDDELKIDFYITMCKYEKQEYEEEPIALILCTGKDNEEIELLDMGKDNIHVSEYWLSLPPKNLLEEKLHTAIANAELKQEIRKND